MWEMDEKSSTLGKFMKIAHMNTLLQFGNPQHAAPPHGSVFESSWELLGSFCEAFFVLLWAFHGFSSTIKSALRGKTYLPTLCHVRSSKQGTTHGKWEGQGRCILHVCSFVVGIWWWGPYLFNHAESRGRISPEVIQKRIEFFIGRLR